VIIGQNTLQNHLTTRLPRLIVPLALLVLTLLLWLPFGFNITCVLDGWHAIANIEAGLPWIPAARPLVPLPFILAYLITPGSFVGFNIMLAFEFWLKAWLFYLALRQLRLPVNFAFALAALTLLSPIDPLFFYLSTYTLNTCIIFYLVALNGLLLFWKTRRPSAMALVWIGLSLCVLTYEVLYPIIFLTPLLLFSRGARFNRRFITAALMWLVIPIFGALRLALLALSSSVDFQYQSDLIAQAPAFDSMIGGIGRVYIHTLLEGWWMNLAPATPLWLAIALVSGLLVGGITFWLSRQNRDQALNYRVIIGCGFVIIGLGVVMFLRTALFNQLGRIYFIPAFGAAFVFCGVFGWVSLRRLNSPLVFATLTGVLAALGSLQLLEQHSSFVTRTEAQQRVMLQMAEAIPRPVTETAVIVVDESPDRVLASVIPSSNNFIFPYIATYLYADYDLFFTLCYLNDAGLLSDNRCIFADDYVSAEHVEWVRRSDRALVPYQRYDRALVLTYTTQNGFVIAQDITRYTTSEQARAAYDPDLRLVPDSLLPARVTSEFLVVREKSVWT